MKIYKKRELNCMEFHSDEGTKYDLAHYRLERAENDLKSAKLKSSTPTFILEPFFICYRFP